MKKSTKPKVDKSRKKGEVRTSMFVTESIYNMCGDVSKRVGLPMRQIWEAGVLSVAANKAEDIKQVLSDAGIIPGWRARK